MWIGIFSRPLHILEADEGLEAGAGYACRDRSGKKFAGFYRAGYGLLGIYSFSETTSLA